MVLEEGENNGRNLETIQIEDKSVPLENLAYDFGKGGVSTIK